MRSLYSGISGLRVHQTKMDVIANNIANVNTTAFKMSRATFNEVFSQTLQGATAGNEGKGGMNPQQVGLGANLASIDVIMTEGPAQRTDNPLDLKIEGDGFFVVTDGMGEKFTRDGSFKLDVNGYLTNSAGYKVCGWPADFKTGDVEKAPVEPLQILTANTYSVDPEKTTELVMQKNLNMNDGNPLKGGVVQLASMYDSLGNEYSIQYKMKYFADEESVLEYNTANNLIGQPGEITYAAADLPVWAITGIDSVKDANKKEVMYGDTAAGAGNLTLAEAMNDDGISGNGFPKEIRFDKDGKVIPDAAATDPDTGTSLGFRIGAPGFADSPILGVESDLGNGRTVNINYGGLTQLNSPTTAVTDGAEVGGGRAPGTFNGFSIGSDGVISAKYTNGDLKTLGQVVLADFANPAGLQKVGGNLFEKTMNSGEFDGIGVEPNVVGALNSGTLEMSNVDLSKEFTEMITTQRGFQANSRIITTSDTLLEELTNLKR